MAITSRAFKLAATACAVAAYIIPLASAQLSGGPRADGSIILYDRAGFGGEAIQIDSIVPSMSEARFNDRASSIEIRGGPWEVCVDGGFRGRCEIITRDIADLSQIRLNNTISSVRPVGQGRPGGGPRGGGLGHDGGAPIVLYSGEDFRGEARGVFSDERGLDRFNDRARSVRVNSGAWLLCEDVDYRGRCEYVDRDIRDLREIGLHGRLSSLQLTSFDQGPGSEAITLFQHPDFRGDYLGFDQDVRGLSQYNFNDQISSIRVTEGSWLICEDGDFRGRCEIINGDIRSLSDLGMNDRISSFRRLRPGDRHGDGYGRGRPGQNGGVKGDQGFDGEHTVFFPNPTDRYGNRIRNGSGQATRFCQSLGLDGAVYKGRGSYLVDVLCQK